MGKYVILSEARCMGTWPLSLRCCLVSLPVRLLPPSFGLFFFPCSLPITYIYGPGFVKLLEVLHSGSSVVTKINTFITYF